MKVSYKAFEDLLRIKAVSKKAFAAYAQIPYYTVCGWKKSGSVPAYAMVLLRQMPSNKESVTAGELIEAGMPRAVLWNNAKDKKVPIDIFIISTLQKAYNDFVIDKLVEFFGEEKVLTALIKHRDHLSDRLLQSVLSHIKTLPQSA